MNTSVSAIVDRWFISEPLLFAALCTHKMVENRDMRCTMRSGKLRIEYNPELLEGVNDLMLEMMLRREVVRILLKHPYQRQPLNPVPGLLTLASDITIYQHRGTIINPLRNTGIEVPPRLAFEEYYNMLLHAFDACQCNARQCDECASSSGNKSGQEQPKGKDDPGDAKADLKALMSEILDDGKADASALWEEDSFLWERMNQLIENAMVTEQWGSVPGDMKVLLEVSMQKSLNVRRQLGLFKASILSTQRRLTRMRPSRRYGWEQMGVLHPYTTRLLIAIDVSGSILDGDLRRFFGVINSFFSYGIPQIDVLQFDCKLHLPLLSLRKVKSKIEAIGRGGTSFDPPVSYFETHKEYDGMIVFTDGYAPIPRINTRRRILWVLKDRQCYERFPLLPKIYL